MYLRFKKLDERAIIPNRTHVGDAGLDLYAIEDFVVPARMDKCVSIGVASEFPSDYALRIIEKSGRARNNKLTIGASLIDSSYRGPIHVHLINNSDIAVHILAGEKIAQAILMHIWSGEPEEVSELSETTRNDGGFGSTGLK